MDHDEFARRAEALRARLYRTAYLYLGSEADALEAVDEGVYQALRALRQLRQPDFFETWLTRILINECKGILRQRGRQAPYDQAAAEAIPAPAEEDHSDLYAALGALEEKNDMESRGRIENVQELKSNILGFLEQQPEDATLSGFLNEIALYTDLDSVEASDDCVTMMTIHSAKGLEFPVVYVVGMEEGIFPGASAQYDQEELEEERRLFYVAMTRAKEKLTLTNCRQRMLYGRTSANRASRFLEEIPEENMRWESKPEPRFGGMEHDGTFGGDRYEDGWGSSPARAGGSWSSGGVHSYRAPAQAPQRPLASVQQASSTRKNAAPAAPLLQLQQGDMVEHTAFGKGMVLSVRPMGGDALTEVAFDTVGKKKLMLKSAGAHMRKL